MRSFVFSQGLLRELGVSYSAPLHEFREVPPVVEQPPLPTMLGEQL